MSEKNLTALVALFARSYHYENNKIRIFSDTFAKKILSEEEYKSISENMIRGINFFYPGFKGTDEMALKMIVDNYLSPSILARSIFCEDMLDSAINNGCKQYLIFASGYDTYAYRKNNDIKLFEIDKKEMINDKIKRLEKNNIEHSHVSFINCDFTKDNWINNILLSDYLTNKLSFSSLLGIIYYLPKAEFKKMIHNISNIVSKDSYILFDYPTYEESKETSITSKLAKGANEKMKAKYSYGEIENILLENGFIVCKHLDYKQMSDLYFYKYNSVNPDNQIFAPKGVNYCLAMKKLKLFDTFFE